MKKNFSTVSSNELEIFLDWLDQQESSYVQKRRILTIALIYVSGLKAEDLQNLCKQELEEFFAGKSLKLKSKSDKSRVEISLTEEGAAFFYKYKEIFEHLCLRKKKPSSYVFSTEKYSEYPLSLQILQRDISKALSLAKNSIGRALTIKSLIA